MIELAKACGTQLQGERPGKRHYSRICELICEVPEGNTVLIDFRDVNVVTGSWLNAAIVPLFRRAAEPEINLFPILCNMDKEWVDDLKLVAKWNQQFYLLARGKSVPRRATLVGVLDAAQKTTLEEVLELGEVTGAELERRRPDDRIGATAWNNRLKELSGKRLLRRTKRGREQVYSPVVKEMVIDG